MALRCRLVVSNVGDQNLVSGPQTSSQRRNTSKDMHRMNKSAYKDHNINLQRGMRGVCHAAKESVATTSNAERFLEDLDDGDRVSVDDGDAVRQELQMVQSEIDEQYRQVFEGFPFESAVDTDGEDVHIDERDMAESIFQSISRESPNLSKSMLQFAEQQGDGRWKEFQKTVTVLKMKRSRLERQLEQIDVAKVVDEQKVARFSKDRSNYEKLDVQRPEQQQGEQGDSSSTEKLKKSSVRIVLMTGFESFNSDLYRKVAVNLSKSFPSAQLIVFNDRDLETRRDEVSLALAGADVFFSSLIFDFDQVEWLNENIKDIPYRFIFESSLELMSSTKVGGFQMAPGGQKSGPPPAVKKVLNLFGSGKEEDKLVGYLSFLKIGPKLLKYLPGKKVQDLRNWLTVYSYWNQGGEENVTSMINYILRECFELPSAPPEPRALLETPATGCLHPEAPGRYFESPDAYMQWYERHGPLKKTSSPRAAVLLYRKHVITKQPYINDLIECLEKEGIIPIPIFINGVEAHTIVRDQLTSDYEVNNIRMGNSSTMLSPGVVSVDAVINTIGFPLVGGPSGTMGGGRQIDISKSILSAKNIPYMIAAPLLIQDMESWVEKGITGLQSVVLYSLPELDGAIDSVPLGALVGENIYLIPERVTRLAGRVKNWVSLRKKPPSEKKVGIILYGFPPGVGATGTAALLNVPKSLEKILYSLKESGYDLGDMSEESLDGEKIVAYLQQLSKEEATCRGIHHMTESLNTAVHNDLGAQVVGADIDSKRLKEFLTFDESWGPNEWGPMPFLPSPDILVKKMENAWGDLGKYRSGLATTTSGNSVVAGLQFGNVFIGVQPLLGVEGDPMRLLFERDLTPHPQYAAFYKWIEQEFQADGVIHCGTHGTSEWLPGSPLGNTGLSWSDIMLSSIPNIYIYTANNPSESIIAKRRGYGTTISHNVPPYGRSGLYKQLIDLKALLLEYRETNDDACSDLRVPIIELVESVGLEKDCPFVTFDAASVAIVDETVFSDYVSRLYTYLLELENRLYSEGLHILGSPPNDEQMHKYLSAYFDGKLDDTILQSIVEEEDERIQASSSSSPELVSEAASIRDLLKQNTNEISSILKALDGEYILPEAGGDLLRDGVGVLPTGRNIYALDPYRMPGPSAQIRGAAAADAILQAHLDANDNQYPETVAVSLWGLDAIKTKGESVAITLALIGARPVKEGTGRIVRFELIPLSEMNRPRIDVLCNVSGIFRDSFQNVLDLLDDLFKRAAEADEPADMNYIRKHAMTMSNEGLENPTARLFSNPSGDYGSMVNERVGASNWEDGSELGSTWVSRNAYSYGRGSEKGVARPEVLQSLLKTTDRVVQEIDSVEYGLTDIQEYYANTGALRRAAETAKGDASSKVGCSIIETFSKEPTPKELEDVLRLEYRSKLLNPKWADAMANSGSGGAFEISQRMTAMIGWGATVDFKEDWAWNQAAETYAFDQAMATKLKESNPEAFTNILKRMIEASGRGMWNPDEDTLDRLKSLYSEMDDTLEGI
ncbi:Magnesium-chelatase subunit H [Picochlorum sp. SENEW3]|nr:Magnesium-chelatase subunit H [Picochlorum sp. SENEW3]